MSFEGKVAVVTGGRRGIGRAVAATLARAGCDVAFCDLCSEEEAGETIADIQQAGRQAAFYNVDVGRRDAVLSMFDDVIQRFGRVDILVNNAAINIRKFLVDLEVEDVERVWSVALWGVFHCSQAAARQMVKQGSGAIVMISSVHAEQAFPRSTAYNGAKAAVNQMARTWAAELAPSGIRVNIVEPGWTDTPGERTFFTEQQILEQGRALPMKRLATADEIASAVRFLASEEASYINGSSLRVDGALVLPRIP